MIERPLAVEVLGVSKKFRLFKERNNTLKGTIMRGRRVIADDFWALRDNVPFEGLPRARPWAVDREVRTAQARAPCSSA